MSFTKRRAADLSTAKTAKGAARRARIASLVARANARQAATLSAQGFANAAQVRAQTAAAAAQIAAQNAAVAAANVAQSAGDAAQVAAQTAAVNVSNQVRHGVYSARSWAAPRLDSAADYCTTTAAPKVSAALRSTARQVSPETNAKKRTSLLTWSLLGAAIFAGLGAVGAVVRYRYRTAIAADSEVADEEAPNDFASTQPAASTDASPTTADTAEQSSDTSVNGRVNATGR